MQPVVCGRNGLAVGVGVDDEIFIQWPVLCASVKTGLSCREPLLVIARKVRLGWCRPSVERMMHSWG